MLDASTAIREARVEAGLTQRALADRMGVAQPVVARLERAGSNPTYRVFTAAMTAAGRALVTVPVDRGNVDRGLVKGRLQRTPAQRLLDFEHALTGARAFAVAAERARGNH